MKKAGKNSFRWLSYCTTYLTLNVLSVVAAVSELHTTEGYFLAFCFIAIAAAFNYLNYEKGISPEFDHPYIKKRKNLYLVGIIVVILMFIGMILDICYETREYNIGPGMFLELLRTFEFGGYMLFNVLSRAYLLYVFITNYRLSLRLNGSTQENRTESANVTDQPEHNIEHTQNTEPVAKEEVSPIASENVQQETISKISPMIPEEDTCNESVEIPDDHPNFCRRCGAKLESDSIYCHKCGTKVVK